MKKRAKKKKTTKKGAKLKIPIYFIVLLTACVALALITVVVVIVNANQEPKIEFIPPEFEENAQEGIPEVSDDLKYGVVSNEAVPFLVSLCGVVKQENQEATVYFTSHAENDEWLKLRIYDENNEIVGETGLIKAGEYVASVALNRELESGAKIKIKIMGYEIDTYKSVGSVAVETEIE